MNGKEFFKESEWKRLLHSIETGKCVLILGPEVATDTEQRKSISSRLAEAISKKFNLDKSVSSYQLPHVVETYLNEAGTRYELEDFVEEFYAGLSIGNTPFYDQLAALPFNTYLTTTHDNFLLNALLKAKHRTPQLGFYHLHKDVMSNLNQPSVANPIIYQIFGSLEDLPSLVLGENDILNFIQNVVSASPGLANQVQGVMRDRDTTFLFIGFEFDQWYARIMVHTLLGNERHQRKDLKLSTVLERDQFFQHPDSNQSVAYFRNQHKFGFYQYSTTQFISELLERCQEIPAEKQEEETHTPQTDIPKVFLSYRRKELDEVLELKRKLVEHGISVWLDVDNLRGGDRWEQALDNVISKQVDRFILVQTPSLVEAKESVVFDELDMAKKRDKRTNPDSLSRFIIPVVLEPSTKRLDAISEFNEIDLSQDTGFSRLISTIKQSI